MRSFYLFAASVLTTVAVSGCSSSSHQPSGAQPAGPKTNQMTPPRVDTPPCTTGCQCANGIDDDGDGLIDWQQDHGCTSRDDGSEGGLATGTVENGWTVAEPSKDTTVIYVSSSVGDDGLDGLAADPSGSSGPKKTLGAAMKSLRDGFPDWLLLRRGDTWTENMNLPVSGRSAAEPMLIASYGDSLDRPLIHGNLVAHRSNLMIMDLSLQTSDAGSPLLDLQGSNLLAEGCRLEGGGGSINVVGPHDTLNAVAVRRNTSINSQSNAFFFSYIHGLLVEENVISQPGPTNSTHAMYITRVGNEDVITRGNVVYMNKDTGNGIMQRAGGLAEGNVIVGCGWTGIPMGSCNDEGGPSNGPCEPPIHAEYRGNLLLDGRNNSGGLGGDVEYIAPGAVMADNVALRAGILTGSEGITFENNILEDVQLSVKAVSGITWKNNQVLGTLDQPLVLGDDLPNCKSFSAQGNHFYSSGRAPDAWFKIPQQTGFDGWQKATGETGSGDPFEVKDAGRTLAGYDRENGGGGSADSFFKSAVEQAKFRYAQQYTAAALIQYFREGLTIQGQ